MMLVLLVSQYLFKPAPGPKPVAPVNDKAAAQLASKPNPQSAVKSTTPDVPTTAGVAGQVQAGSTMNTEIDTDLYHIVFTNKGAVATSWVLKKFKDKDGKPLELINPAAAGVPAPFSLDFLGQKPAFDANTVLYMPTVSDAGNKLDFEYSDGKTSIHKSFQFKKDSYLANVKSEVLQNNNAVPALLTWRGGFGDQKVFKSYTHELTVHYDASAGKLITKNTKDAKNGPFSETGNFTFGGVEDNFFAAVALPTDSAP